ncbi:MAG: 23S rRNA (uracil(1939)-C(5))-methyltransferase RlmD [Clostridia bacterium]|nr:23S rRNA (uracil(1939)-C(5))-methyltransferase RlmD [Clostridia bacterium]
MKKNDVIKLHISDLTSEGMGVGKTDDGFVVFVSGAVTGDTVDAHILKVGKSYAYAKVKSIVTPSDIRCECDCSSFGKCGGCMFRHIGYDSEQCIKIGWVNAHFARIGGLDIRCESIESPCVTRYRNKAQYPAAQSNGKVVFGFYANRTHRVITSDGCMLEPEFYAEIVDAVSGFCTEYNIPAYDETTGAGIVRHLYIRDGRQSGEVMAALIINADTLPHADKFVDAVRGACDSIVSVMLIVNKKRNNEILGDKCITLYGKDHITDTLCGLQFDISPLSFYQVNHDGAERLYEIARELAAPTKSDTVLDLYCGAGTIGLSMAHTAKRIVGVEIVPAAIENARSNAAKNGIDNAEFICADAGIAAAELAERGLPSDIVILDPPRKGCGAEVFPAVAKMRPKTIVMISCNSATAARDAAMFDKIGYKAIRLTAVDMFPRTGHVETVVLMSRA